MKNILVPTDLSIRSLNYLHNLAERNDEVVSITLMHALRMPDSILDLWMFTKSGRHHTLVTGDFREACEVMKNKYAKTIREIKVEFFYGSTTPALRNFLKAHEIHEVAMPQSLVYQCPGSESYNPEKLLKKCRLPIRELIIHTPKQTAPSATSIAELLVLQN
ncbi:hypothetical protein [Chitinophaga niabensis]|uniref:Universal stress protein family protein n=1 Tax=Chitinophaga niabensis TaxID=536979 RepID=A0A1N6KC95_9BACT|nr:hypothetical protein [Chitinophaga niabensis]SIO54204.1 hypothetical protein SAMN04488055_5558 [Chitinophaga niabensis]